MDQGRVFGPVPSRRLGRSLGINTIPPKSCTYACVYCQLGRASGMTVKRQAFYPPEDLLVEVSEKLRRAAEHDESIDYLAIVPDGEPTLDRNLGKLVGLLKGTGIAVAVITNGSLLGRPEVGRELEEVDWVSVKVDAVSRELWRRIDRPHKGIVFEAMLAGIEAFAGSFPGHLATETMLIKGLNDTSPSLDAIARFLEGLRPAAAYLSIPTRPPAEPWVEAPNEASIHHAYQVFRKHGLGVELLTGYEGTEFAYTGNLEQDLLGIVSVHPMREDALRVFLGKAGADFAVVEKLVAAGKLIVLDYEGARFYQRKLKRETPPCCSENG